MDFAFVGIKFISNIMYGIAHTSIFVFTNKFSLHSFSTNSNRNLLFMLCKLVNYLGKLVCWLIVILLLYVTFVLSMTEHWILNKKTGGHIKKGPCQVLLMVLAIYFRTIWLIDRIARMLVLYHKLWCWEVISSLDTRTRVFKLVIWIPYFFSWQTKELFRKIMLLCYFDVILYSNFITYVHRIYTFIFRSFVALFKDEYKLSKGSVTAFQGFKPCA